MEQNNNNERIKNQKSHLKEILTLFMECFPKVSEDTQMKLKTILSEYIEFLKNHPMYQDLNEITFSEPKR